jgi:AraC-like DNA-binding protein
MCIAVNDRFDENTWNGVPMRRDAWIEAVKTQCGLECRFESSRFCPSTMNNASAGQTIIANMTLAWQSVSTLSHTRVWNDERLYLQIVTSGTMSIEQDGEMATVRPGDMVVIDTLARFEEWFREPARIVLLNISKSALRERGLRMRVPSAYMRDSASPDVGVIRDFVLNVASQAGKASNALLTRLGNQCLDLMDVLVDSHNGPACDRSSALTALRAKQLIARSIGDPGLSVARIAAQLHISNSSLTRALRAHGISPMRYAWSLRLEHAARLLADTSRSAVQIREVAYQCGFTDAAHFSRVFKRRYEMTPREYVASRKTESGDAVYRTPAVARRRFG